MVKPGLDRDLCYNGTRGKDENMRVSKERQYRHKVIDGRRYRVTRIENNYGKRGKKAAPLPEKIRKAPVLTVVK